MKEKYNRSNNIKNTPCNSEEIVDKMDLGQFIHEISDVVIDLNYAMPYAYPRQDKTRQDKLIMA